MDHIGKRILRAKYDAIKAGKTPAYAYLGSNAYADFFKWRCPKGPPPGSYIIGGVHGLSIYRAYELAPDEILVTEKPWDPPYKPAAP